MKIEYLRTNHMTNPEGFALTPLTFSWITTEADGDRTNRIRVQIAKSSDFSTVQFDSGWLDYSGINYYYPPICVENRKKYFWKIWVEDNLGNQAVSDYAWFRTEPGAILGEWICSQSCDEKYEAHHSNVIFFKEVTIEKKPIESACLYVSAFGVYEASLNGKKLGSEFLAPFYNDYSNWLQIQTYDLKKCVKIGINTLEFLMGEGWYMGRFGYVDKLDCLYGNRQAIICELEIIYEDGNVQRIVSDSSFYCKKSPVVSSSIYDGEVFDARLLNDSRVGNYSNAVIASEEIQKKKKLLLPRKSLPLKIQQEMKVKQIIYTPAGECVLDFGQNISGILSFRCKEKSGKTIHLYFGEILQDGNFYNENLRTAKQEFTYISDGKERTVRQHFTFYGFRYVKVKGISDVAFADFTAKVLYSDMEVTGHVCTSNIKVNRLFQNAMWGQKGNFIDTPTDCPQRDERMGWTGDAQMFCATASYNMYTPAFFDKYLFDMLKEQRQIQGAVPFVVPDILGRIQTLKKAGILNEEQNNAVGMEPVFGSSAWGDAAVIIPWNMYLFYGDKALLKKQFDNMRLWIDYIQSVDETDESGGRLWKRGFHFGDWLALDSKEENSVFGGTDPYFIASAYYKLSSELTAKAAGILGYSKIEEKYSRLSEEVKRGIWLEYFCESEHWENLTQTACVLALYFDLVPNKNRGKIIHVLKDKLDERGGHLSTGFVGTPYLCPALCEGGLSEYAYTLLLNEDYPGWLYEVNMGATTIWERWNSVLPNGKISDTGMNSLNHYAYGSIVEWMYKYMCGIVPVPEHTGFRHTLIRPFVDRRLRFAQAEYLSVYGKIFSRWEQTARGWELTLQIPMDTSAELVLAGELSRCRVSKVEKMAEKSNGHISNECIFAEQKKTSQPKYILTPGRYRISLEYENEQ